VAGAAPVVRPKRDLVVAYSASELSGLEGLAG
jgi:hypothetical protein